jgi:hypothetical protein
MQTRSCDGCINKGRPCLTCENGRMKALPIQKPKRALSAWERRWVKWAKRESKK